MKNKFLKVFALSGAFALSLGVAININYQSIKDETAVKAANNGPTSGNLSSKQNIDLNDSTADDIRSYYSSLNSLSTSERQGTNLLKNLRTIIHNFTYYSYDSVWKIYEITDREWSLSPASGTTFGSYNSSTNIISNYEYGSNGSPKNDPYVHTLYRNRDSSGVTVSSGRIKNWGSHTQTGGTNREHVWCQSRGFKASSGANGPAGTDVHHLISGDGYVNGTPHNNNPYGYVGNITIDSKSSYSYCAGNYAGSPLHTHSGDKSSVVFEPQDSDKGDIARACFYMVACYNNLSGNESISQYDPNLTMVDYTSSTSTEISSASSAVSMGILSDLLAWHKADPVDEYEIHRNNLIYKNYQYNRNPFVDFPEWVDYIWGTVQNGGTSSQTYNSTPTGYAKPSSDTINGYNGGVTPEVTLSSITISGQKTTFDVGDTFTFGGTVTAHYSDNTTANVTSSATFSGYDMSEDGNQTVTVSYTEGGVTKTTTYNITVNPVVTLSYITISGQQTAFNVGDTFTFGGTVTAHYSDDSTANVTTSATFSGYNMNNAGQQTVTVSYTEGGITRTKTYKITVTEVVTLSYITVSGQQTSYNVGDNLNFSGTVTAHYSNNTTADVTDDAIFTGYNLNNAGNQTVTVSYTEGGITRTTTYDITVSEVVTLEYITVSGQQTVFTVDDDFAFEGIVTAHYSDDSTENVTAAAEFSGYDMSVAGQQTVIVSYTEGDITEETSYTITVTSSGGDIPSGDAALYSGALTEGDYVIYYDGKAMKNTVSSNRLSYLEVTPTNDIISQPDESIIWHIAPSGDYWTIYNVSVARYAAGNGTKNQGVLIDSVTDYAKWTVSGTSEYEFVNKGNETANVNKNLRNNGTYGFACYSTSTGDALSLFKVSDSPIVPVDPTSISATVNKTYKVGETINKSDITVIDDLNRTITDFSFANDGYQFTYADAASGGELTNKVFTNAITYGALGCSLTAQVQREGHSVPAESLQHTGAEFQTAGIGSSYEENQTATVDGITFRVGGYVYNNNRLSLSLSKTMATGSVVNTTPYPAGITNVTVNGATPDIQLSVNGTSDWVDLADALVDEVNYLYLKIFFKDTTVTSYVNIYSFTVTYKGVENATSVSDYIMYEDTVGQCENGKFAVAKSLFESMSKADRQTFMTSDDYVISTARERFVAWANHLGKTIEYVDGDYIVNANASMNRNVVDASDDTAIMIIVVSLFTISLFGTILLIKKKKMR